MAARGARTVVSGPGGFRVGERIEFIELSQVTHFSRRQAHIRGHAAKNYAVDYTIQELEHKLDPTNSSAFIAPRWSTWHTYRNCILVRRKMMLRLKDPKHTEIAVSRDRVRAVKERLGL